MGKAEFTPQANDVCRISKGTKITGVVISSADVRVDGVVEGTIYTKGKLVVGETAKINGKIFCQSCDLWGQMDGEAYMEELINFKASAVFAGDLRTPQLGIEIGAKFNGTCHIITKEEYNGFLKNLLPEVAPAAKPVVPKAPEPKK